MASPGSTLSSIGFFVESPGQLGDPSPLLADNIDPQTNDYRDLFVGVDPIDDQVLVTAMTRRGSGGSVLDVGVRITPTKILPSTQDQLTGDYRLAFARLIKARDISFARVSFGYDDGAGNPSGENDEANQAVQMNIEYRNLRALDNKIRRVTLKAQPQITVTG